MSRKSKPRKSGKIGVTVTTLEGAEGIVSAPVLG